MRSSKSRSRSKSNRQRSVGNIINRVFDSSGPEGKVRGTPQQIIDKYLMLARDAQLGNDRVAEQNFLQHAEHYTRMLGEAQRELNREQAERQAEQQARQQERGDQQQRDGRGERNGNGNGNGHGYDRGERNQDRGERHERNDRAERAFQDRREADDQPVEAHSFGLPPAVDTSATDTSRVDTADEFAVGGLPAFLTGEEPAAAARPPRAASRSRNTRARKPAAEGEAAPDTVPADGTRDE